MFQQRARIWISFLILMTLFITYEGRNVSQVEAATSTVNSLADTDDGTCNASNCTLREAINATNGVAGADIINFSVSGTITVGSQLSISDDLTINGSGITLDGNNSTRIMDINLGITVELNELVFQNGSLPSGNGGAIYSGANLTVNDSTFIANDADRGGAIWNRSAGTIVINNSTFYDNQVIRFGGGFYNREGTAAINNSTFYNNQSHTGGGVYNYRNGDITINSSTFSNNVATNTGASLHHNVASGSGVTGVESTIIVDGNCGGGIPWGDLGNNIAFNATNCPGTVVDPQLGPLQNNGGTTDTMLPSTDGPAVDAYSGPCNTASDQRGISRPQGGGCDAGATEQTATTALDSTVSCVGADLNITITAGDGPFDITAASGPGLPLNGVGTGTQVLTGPATWMGVTVTETSGSTESENLGDFTCVAPTDTPTPTPTNTPTDTPTATLTLTPSDTPTATLTLTPGPVTLVAFADCLDENVVVTISAGDGPFNITASGGGNTPVSGVGIGSHTIIGPDKWDDLTVTETSDDFEWINLGQFKCRTDERPVPLTPAHRSHTTNPYPLFSWTAINYASNYRVFVFDNKVAADRTVDIRQNSGGPTSMTLSTPLPDGRLFWRVRGRQNRVWSLWSVRFTLFKDPVAPIIANTPVPTIDLNSPSDGETEPTMVPTTGPAPTFPPPPNSR